MKTLYTNASRTVLELIKAKLETEGIPCYIRHEFPPAAGYIPPVIASPELCVVDDTQFVKAEKILQEILKEQGKPKTPWMCPNCKTEVDGELNICWKCGTSRN